LLLKRKALSAGKSDCAPEKRFHEQGPKGDSGKGK